MKMKIEEGKSYCTASGGSFGPMEKIEDEHGDFYFIDVKYAPLAWTSSGECLHDDSFDLVREDIKNPPNKRSSILQEAEALINGPREYHYGTPRDNFQRIALGWSVLLDADVSPEQVALCMAWLKMARLVNGPHEDSYVDGAAYLALAGELALG